MRGDSYKCADGCMLENKGEVTTEIFTVEGHSRTVTWQNVDIEMPIMSTASYNDDNYDVRYQTAGGQIINLQTNERSKFIRHGDVFFQKIIIRRPRKTNPGFVRPGTP